MELQNARPRVTADVADKKIPPSSKVLVLSLMAHQHKTYEYKNYLLTREVVYTINVKSDINIRGHWWTNVRTS
jgi:hypothetical protein